MLETIPLPSTGSITTRLGFGCSGLMGGLSERESLRLLETAWDAGIRHYDVAPSYGHGLAESCLGRFLRGKAEATVTTKYGIRPPAHAGLLGLVAGAARPVARRLPGMRQKMARAGMELKSQASFSARDAQRSLEHSLRQLGVERISLWLLHEPDPHNLDGSDLLPWMGRMQQQGKIGAFGIGAERRRIGALWAEHRDYCPVLQYEVSTLESHPRFPGAFCIFFRAISGAVPVFSEWLDRHPDLRRQWSADLDTNLAERQNLAPLLLQIMFIENPDSVVLFSSRNPEHIQANVHMVMDKAWRERAQLFRELVKASTYSRA